MNLKKTLTIGMPALNEALRIEKTLRDVYTVAKKTLNAFEIIVVDDGSTDNTSAVVLALAQTLGPEIQLIQKKQNEGLGFAFQSVLEVAQYDNITSIVSDGAYYADGIENLFNAINDIAVILGYRINFNGRPFQRRFLSKCVTKYVEWLTHKKLKDTQGLFVTKTALCKKIQFPFARYNFQMQVVSFCLNHSDSFKEVPVIYSLQADLNSNMLRKKVLIDVIQSSWHLLKCKLFSSL